MNNKTIYINGRFLLSPQTGVERFAYELCKALVNIGVKFFLICPKNGELNAVYETEQFQIIRYGIGHSHLWEQLVLPTYFFFKSNYIVISFTGLGSVLTKHKIMTIHDLSFLENPSWFSKAYYFYYKMMTPLAAITSKKIITVSLFSKKQIIKNYNFINKKNIEVIYNATRFSVKESHKALQQRKKTYFLAVSSLDPRKNFSRLISAFEKSPNLYLKVVGGKSRIHAFVKEQKQCANIEFIGRVSDSELVHLYENAKAFIFPSLYEGFGIPPIEAMALGCPVLASDIPVIKEVCNDAALYFNPLSVDSIIQTIEDFNLKDNKEIDTLVQKGYKNSQKYSWADSAQKLLSIIQ